MRKRILSFVFAAALLAAFAVPLFGGAGTALAVPAHVEAAHCQDLANGQITGKNTQVTQGVHTAHQKAGAVLSNLCP